MITVCTVAAVAVVPLAADLRTPEGSAAPIAGVTEVSSSTAAEVPSAQRASEVSGPEGSPVVEPSPAAAATLAADPDVASDVVEGYPAPVAAEPVPGTATGTPTAVVPSTVPLTPPGAVADSIDDAQIEEPSGRTVTDVTDVTDVVAEGGPALIDDGVGSGMGGDLPPEALPTPAYPQCPITESGPWWTDPADPYTCIPPDSIPFHEPAPPGIPPELLEPIVEAPEAPGAPEAPEGSVGWFEPTPPGIDPALLEPIIEETGSVESAE